MAGIIRLLPDNISNQIAAGEVIQRPASAVKELLENAIDAGSNSIRLVIKNAGKSLIQVIDDGCGMTDTDARMCFEKHATSKIRNIDDLFAVQTMGFRGEALASVAAIAQVELKTKRHEDEVGTCIQIEGSKVTSQEACQTASGTSFAIKNLFYNVPARRNFLKSNAVEVKHIIEEFQRVALAHPNIAFSLFNDDSQIFQLQKGNLRQRIVGLFGNNYNERVVPIEEETDVVSISGFVGKPQNAKKTRGEQYIFVNKRFIKSGYLNHAIFRSYTELIAKDHFPFFVLFLEIDPNRIDINVHPTKQEIKFDDERVIYTFISAATKHALAQYNVAPTLDFDVADSFDALSNFTHIRSPKQNIPPNTATVTKPQTGSMVTNWEQLYEVSRSDNHDGTVTIPSKGNDLLTNAETEVETQSPYQIHQRYIVSQIKSGFILIEQQAAHERVWYERYRASVEARNIVGQKLLFPQQIDLQAADAVMISEMLDDIQNLGFDIQTFGQNSFVIHSFPADITNPNAQQIIEELLEQYKNNLQIVQLDKRESMLRSLAYSSAIKKGQKLTTQEMHALIDELFACENPYTTPQGRQCFITLDFDTLEKQFENK